MFMKMLRAYLKKLLLLLDTATNSEKTGIPPGGSALGFIDFTCVKFSDRGKGGDKS